MAMFRKKKDTGPKYSADVVDRDTFRKADIGSDHNGRRVVEGFLDQETGDYVLVTIAKKESE